MKKYLAILLLCCICSNAQLAFPGAVGYGRNTTGGRGGQIYHVTNLNNTGAGSLRYGMESITGARCIVFDVSGYINITTPLKIRDGYKDVSILGQTSPEGIVIRGAEINIHDDNVIVRFIKVAPGEDAYNPGNLPPSDPDYEPADSFTVKAFSGQGGINNVMLDHLTLIWGHDSIIDFGGGPNEGSAECRNISLTNSLIAENIDKGYGTLVNGAYNVTFNRNVFYSLYDRTPAISSKDAEGVDYINNYHFHTTRAAWYRRGNKVDFINNVWETGSNLTRQWETFRMEAEFNTNIVNTAIYLSGNTDDGVNADTAVNSPAIPYLTGSPYHSNSVPTIPTNDVKNALLNNVGASLFYDSSDIRIFNNIINDNGAFVTDEANVGGYPSRGTATRSPSEDSDNDHMLDVAEIAIWGNITTVQLVDIWSDTPGVNITDYNGFPNIEKVWAWQASDANTLPSPEVPTETSVLITNNKRRHN